MKNGTLEKCFRQQQKQEKWESSHKKFNSDASSDAVRFVTFRICTGHKNGFLIHFNGKSLSECTFPHAQEWVCSMYERIHEFIWAHKYFLIRESDFIQLNSTTIFIYFSVQQMLLKSTLERRDFFSILCCIV